jgi:hypothetical protein
VGLRRPDRASACCRPCRDHAPGQRVGSLHGNVEQRRH